MVKMLIEMMRRNTKLLMKEMNSKHCIWRPIKWFKTFDWCLQKPSKIFKKIESPTCIANIIEKSLPHTMELLLRNAKVHFRQLVYYR